MRAPDDGSLRPEPYLAAVVALVLFTPVLALEHETRLDIVYVSGTGPFGEVLQGSPFMFSSARFSSAHSNSVVWHRQEVLLPQSVAKSSAPISSPPNADGISGRLVSPQCCYRYL
mgnify:CR=1 FL=1